MNTKKLSIGLLSALCVALCALLAWFIIPQDVSTYADDETEDEIPVSLLVNGQIVTDVLSFTYGDSFVVEVSYNGNVYEPVLYLEESGAAFTQDHNELTVKQGSVLGETEIEVSRTFPDGREYTGILMVNVYTTVNLSNILVTDNERVMTVDLPDNVAYVDAIVYMQDYVGSRSLRLYDGDIITEVLPESPHGICGLELYIITVAMITSDNMGRRTIQPIDPDDLTSYKIIQTDRLSGSGTWLNPYKITSQSDFFSIPSYDDSSTKKYFKQTTDFTISTSFTPVSFYGDYYGSILRHSITLSSITNSYAGLFRKNYGTIRYVTVYVDNLTISTIGSAGVVCAENYGEVACVKVFGYGYDESTNNYATWIGNMQNYTFTEHVHFNGLATAGGIAGYNNGYIDVCQVELKVSVAICFGGITYNNVVPSDPLPAGQGVYACKAHCLVKSVQVEYDPIIGGLVGDNYGYVGLASPGDTYDSTSLYVILQNTTNPSSTSYPEMGGMIGRNRNTQITFNDNNTPNYLVSMVCLWSNGSNNLMQYNVSNTYIKKYIGRNY